MKIKKIEFVKIPVTYEIKIKSKLIEKIILIYYFLRTVKVKKFILNFTLGNKSIEKKTIYFVAIPCFERGVVSE